MMLELLQRGVRLIVDVLLWPFSFFGERTQIAGAAFIIGIIFLLLYGKLSSQVKIKEVKRAIQAALLETILFRHQPGLCVAAQGRMLSGAVRYFLLAVPPVLFLALPFVLLSAEMQLRFGYRALSLQEPLLLKAVARNADAAAQAELKSGPDLAIVGPVRVPSGKEIYWRVQAKTPGRYSASLQLGGEHFPLEFAVAEQPRRIEAFSYSSLWQQLFFFSDLALQPSFKKQLSELNLNYPSRDFSFFGFRLHWLLPFIILSILAGLAASFILGIEV